MSRSFKILPLLMLLLGSADSFSQTNIILSEGFEGSFPTNTGWVFTNLNSSPSAVWASVDESFGGEGSHGGSRKLYCAGSGYLGSSTNPMYRNNMDVVISTNLDLRGYRNVNLSFWYKIKIPELDFYSDYMLAQLDWDDLWDSTFLDGSVGTWTRVVVPIENDKRAVRMLTFEFNSDGINLDDPDWDPPISDTDFEGAYLDDIEVTGELIHYSLDLKTVGEGSIQSDSNPAFFTYGQTATLTPNPTNNFLGWSGDVSGTNVPLTVVMDGSKTIIATFKRPKLTIDLTGGAFALTLASGGTNSVTVQTSTNLTVWENYVTFTNQVGTTNLTLPSPSGPSKFFRLSYP